MVILWLVPAMLTRKCPILPTTQQGQRLSPRQWPKCRTQRSSLPATLWENSTVCCMSSQCQWMSCVETQNFCPRPTPTTWPSRPPYWDRHFRAHANQSARIHNCIYWIHWSLVSAVQLHELRICALVPTVCFSLGSTFSSSLVQAVQLDDGRSVCVCVRVLVCACVRVCAGVKERERSIEPLQAARSSLTDMVTPAGV